MIARVIDEKSATVSRGAYFGGLAAGISIAVVAYYAISSFAPHGALTAILEIAAVALAFAVTTGIWKVSARRGKAT